MTRAKDISKIVTDADLSGTLDVAGELQVGVDGTTAGLIRLMDSGSVTEEATISTDANGGLIFGGNSGPGELIFKTSSGTERVRITSAGNVGIGTSSPSRQLTVSNSGAALFSLVSTGDDNCQVLFGDSASDTVGKVLYNHSTNAMSFETNGSERMRIASNGWVGIGTTSPNEKLTISSGAISFLSDISTPSIGAGLFRPANNTLAVVTGSTERMRITSAGTVQIKEGNFDLHDANGDVCGRLRPSAGTNSLIVEADPANSASGSYIHFRTDATERMRIDNNGNVGIGTSSPSGRIEAYNASGDTSVYITTANANSSTLFFGDTDSTTIGRIQYDHSTNRMRFHTNGSERMRVNSSGQVLINKTSTGIGSDGVLLSNGGNNFARTSNTVIDMNRQGTDGNIIAFYGQSTFEGSISISGSAVSYNGGHLARWSRLLDNSKDTTIVKGTVMTNLDEMVEWGDEDNEQLNKMAVSSIEGDANVAGIFVNWDDDDDWNDMNVGMTGDMVIRIAQGTTVARGDLLMSAGDGTAKPQGDDIVRSKTIAKVTSTNVSHTYDDGTYLVPCVLMAC